MSADGTFGALDVRGEGLTDTVRTCFEGRLRSMRFPPTIVDWNGRMTMTYLPVEEEAAGPSPVDALAPPDAEEPVPVPVPPDPSEPPATP